MIDKQAQTFEEVVDVFYPEAKAEPLEVPTVEVEGDDVPAEEVSNDTIEAEDEAGKKDDNDDDNDDDTLVYEINGKEYTAEQIESLESGNLMQADYTKKTQALAKDREELDGNTVLLSEAITKTNDLAAQLEVLVGEDKAINWAELKEDDPDEYIRLKERADNRESTLKDVKAEITTKPVDNVDYEVERVKLVEANPQWIKDGKPTDDYKSDMVALDTYYKDNNWSQEQMQRVSENAALVQLVLDDAKRKSDSKVTDQKITKARKKIIATPRYGSKAASTDSKSAEEIFYGTN